MMEFVFMSLKMQTPEFSSKKQKMLWWIKFFKSRYKNLITSVFSFSVRNPEIYFTIIYFVRVFKYKDCLK